MKRAHFLLFAGIYGALLAMTMLFLTESSLMNYGVPKVDVDHIALMQFLGANVGALSLMSLLNRHQPNSFPLRTLLLAQACEVLAGVVLGMYHVLVLHVPFSTFFVVDTLFRLVLGLGFLYYYQQAAREAVAN
ncbi:hypothetical protein [Fibrivirga algicola]|uniref:DUF4345 domain-containing protein n=1 Tax=Fibrivirga algicola TaxID=2950420 RepID=A0ABX0QHB1_9BACT|nr:hypothetical protein [Fibrivirga algicola]NID11831.1 hypothetical protein [Fibrivirga algicola]